jgi:hypothetical protein
MYIIIDLIGTVYSQPCDGGNNKLLSRVSRAGSFVPVLSYLTRPSPNKSDPLHRHPTSPEPVSATPSQFPTTDAYYAQDINYEAGLGLGPDDLGQSPERVEEKSSVFHLGHVRSLPLTVTSVPKACHQCRRRKLVCHPTFFQTPRSS